MVFVHTKIALDMNYAGITLCYGVWLPEKIDPLPPVPEWSKFIEGCMKYRQSLDNQVTEALRTNGHSRNELYKTDT